MKKFLALLVILLLVFVAALAWLPHTPAAAPAAPAETGETAESPLPAPGRVNFEALYDAYPAETVYARIGDRTLTWGEYYEWLGNAVLREESYMESMQSYGLEEGWDDVLSDGSTRADALIRELNLNLLTMTANERYAAEQGVSVSEEELDAMQAEYARANLGEDASAEDWSALLKMNFYTERLFRELVRSDLLLSRVMEARFGANGEKLSTSRLQHFIEDNQLVCCSYLVFLTSDAVEGEAAQLAALAEDTAAELRAVTGSAARIERFEALAAELTEEGLAVPVEQLIFQEGGAAALIEEGCAGLGEGEVSEVLSDSYGYYVFIRLPITAASALDDGSRIGSYAASYAVIAERDERAAELDFVYAEGVTPVRLTDYLG